MVILGRVIFSNPFLVDGVRKNHPIQYAHNMVWVVSNYEGRGITLALQLVQKVIYKL